ncbi:MAG: hypothetical protein IPN88_18575 [Bacteroidetes bacterium]|nr:hypothetical protein [Bacteroidota bacterium]
MWSCITRTFINVFYLVCQEQNVVRDYVEFPSQLLEHWLSTPEVLNKFRFAL